MVGRLTSYSSLLLFINSIYLKLSEELYNSDVSNPMVPFVVAVILGSPACSSLHIRVLYFSSLSPMFVTPKSSAFVKTVLAHLHGYTAFVQLYPEDLKCSSTFL